MPRIGELKLPSDSIKVQTAKRAEWNEARSAQDAHFFTIGYSSRSLADFISALKSVEVVTVIDVRQYPVSMYRPEFSKRNLEASLNSAGIAYWHMPELGVPREVRSIAVETGSRNDIWDWYDSNVTFSLNTFFNVADHPLALLCVELDPTACHRHRLALSLEESGLRGYDL
ncbi:MAG: DUF488 family protein [Gammaproteobacteria bacterium]